MTSAKPVVAICTPVGDKLDMRYVTSLLALDRSQVAARHLHLKGFRVDVARNMITKDVINGHPDVTHLLWIDDDMVFQPDALNRLLALDLPFVGGLCFDRHSLKPVIARLFDKSWGYEPNTIGWLWDYPKNRVIKVDRTGGAFLLIKREVFERVRDVECSRFLCAPQGKSPEEFEAQLKTAKAAYGEWWAPMPDECHAEDLSFCNRAQAAGFEIHVDTGLEIGHVGEAVIGSDYSARQRVMEYHRWQPPLDQLIDALAVSPTEVARERGFTPSLGPCPIKFTHPIASVIIPTFDQEPQFLLAAVKSALAQTVPCEVIVVDDGSRVPVVDSEGGRHELRDDACYYQPDVDPGSNYSLDPAHRMPPGVRVYAQVDHAGVSLNRGVSAALNLGIRRMTTNWFSWLSSDDMFEPEKTEIQLTALIQTHLECSYTAYDIRADRHRGVKHHLFRAWTTMEEQQQTLVRSCAINGSTVLVHVNVLRRVGEFDPSLRYGQDWDMWCRIGHKHLWHGIPTKLVVRREFDNLTMQLAKSGPGDEAVQQRNAEDLKIRSTYAKLYDLKCTCAACAAGKDVNHG